VIVLRGGMIAAGAALVEQAYWVLYIFAAFLIVHRHQDDVRQRHADGRGQQPGGALDLKPHAGDEGTARPEVLREGAGRARPASWFAAARRCSWRWW
jgi:hypothetical protein